MTVAAAIAVFAIFLFVLFVGGKEKAPRPDPQESQPTAVQDKSEDEKKSAETPGFVQLYGDDTETMVGRGDYENLAFFKESGRSFIESLDLEEMQVTGGARTLATGHKVYYSPVSDKEYIISGYTPLYLVNGVPVDRGFLREEETGVRIRTFLSQGEMEGFLSRWESGQRILSGATHGDEGMIIIDGALTDLSFTRQGEDMMFSLYDVAMEICKGTYMPSDRSYISIRPNEFNSINVPTDAANSVIKESYGVVGDTFRFQSWEGEKFTLKATVLNNETMLISAHDASRMFGWRMYTDGKTLHIVSDPLNVSNKVAVYAGNRAGSLITKLEIRENGEMFANTYDSNGNLIQSIPISQEDIDAAKYDPEKEAQLSNDPVL